MEMTLAPMLRIGPEKNDSAEQVSQKRNQYIATACVSLGAMCGGSAMAWTSPALPQLQIPEADSNFTANNAAGIINGENGTAGFYLTESQGSLVGAMLAIGALCSALPAGYVADKFGRKKANMCFAVPFLLNWLLIVTATNPFMLYVARFFSGIAVGAVCVTALMYIGEIAEVSVRGTLGSFFQLSICFGIFLTYLVGSLTSWVGLSWTLMILPLLFVNCMYFMPETPMYLIKTGRISAAEKSLKFFRGNSYNVCSEVKTIKSDLANAEAKHAGLRDLVTSRSNKKALLSALGLMVFQQLSGINAVIFYTVPIFSSTGTSVLPDVAAIIVAVVQCTVSYIMVIIIDKANRRCYLMLSSAGAGACLAALGLYFHLEASGASCAGVGVLPLASLVLFIVAYSLGLGPIPWMIMSELFAPEIKGVASGLAVVCNWALVFLVTLGFPVANSSFGGHVTFYFFAVVMAAATAFVCYYLPETKGKTLAEIQAILSK